jgi:hypothetical protein
MNWLIGRGVQVMLAGLDQQRVTNSSLHRSERLALYEAPIPDGKVTEVGACGDRPASGRPPLRIIFLRLLRDVVNNEIQQRPRCAGSP